MIKKGLVGKRGPFIIIGILCALFMIIAYNFFYKPPRYTIELITKDLVKLKDIFQKIDDECRIVSFEHQKNIIDFLTVGSFVGNDVGSMKLAYPAQWKGPYVDHNPTYEGIEYQIVRTRNGFFITPGQGVQLPNGKVMGKDIHLDEHSNIQKMMHDKNSLMYNDQSMAIPLKLHLSTLKKILLEDLSDESSMS